LESHAKQIYKDINKDQNEQGFMKQIITAVYNGEQLNEDHIDEFMDYYAPNVNELDTSILQNIVHLSSRLVIAEAVDLRKDSLEELYGWETQPEQNCYFHNKEDQVITVSYHNVTETSYEAKVSKSYSDPESDCKQVGSLGEIALDFLFDVVTDNGLDIIIQQ